MDSPATAKRAKVERLLAEAAARLDWKFIEFGYRGSGADYLAEIDAAAYARATADAKAFLAAKELAAHNAQMREAEAALYDARLRIGCDEHVGAAKEKANG